MKKKKPKGEENLQPKQENQDVPDVSYIQALLLAEVIKRLLRSKANIQLSNMPTLELRPITEFMKRMRVSSLEKFETTTYISTINYYSSAENLKKHKAAGVLIIYMEEEFVMHLLKKMEYPIDDEDDEEEVADACGTFCNLVAGNFKTGLTQLGYRELEMSHFSSFQNEILNGVEFCQEQPQKYEISFEVGGVKRIVADLNLGPIPSVDDED